MGMANAQRGETALEFDGKTYVFNFSVNAICELEEFLDANVNTIALQISNFSTCRMKTVRALVWGALRDNHEEMDIIDAGKLISDAGVFEVMQRVGIAFSRAFPAVEEEKAALARPPKKRPGGSG